MLPLFPSVIGVVVTSLLAAGAVRSGALTLWAGAAAVAFGSFIVVVGGFPYLALLVLFVVASVFATRYHFEEKRRQNVQEGTHGERGVTNVLAHVAVPTGIVAVGGVLPTALPSGPEALLFTAALAFGAADTFASEFGVLAGHARSILTGRTVEPGTNGGVSALGEAWAFVGAITTAVFSTALFLLFGQSMLPIGLFLPAVTLAGFLGCQVDSAFGETLENRGLLSKGGTNLVSMAVTVLIAWLLIRALGLAFG